MREIRNRNPFADGDQESHSITGGAQKLYPIAESDQESHLIAQDDQKPHPIAVSDP